MVEEVNHKMPRSKGTQSVACSLPSLYKYMRRRKIVSRAGYYLEIKTNGEVTTTRNPSSIYSKYQDPYMLPLRFKFNKFEISIDRSGDFSLDQLDLQRPVF